MPSPAAITGSPFRPRKSTPEWELRGCPVQDPAHPEGGGNLARHGPAEAPLPQPLGRRVAQGLFDSRFFLPMAIKILLAEGDLLFRQGQALDRKFLGQNLKLEDSLETLTVGSENCYGQLPGACILILRNSEKSCKSISFLQSFQENPFSIPGDMCRSQCARRRDRDQGNIPREKAGGAEMCAQRYMTGWRKLRRKTEKTKGQAGNKRFIPNVDNRFVGVILMAIPPECFETI